MNTCEAALRVVIETLMAPPFMRKGDAYRGRMIFPYGEDIEWGAAYGRAFPPKYKNAAIDRSVSAGELAMEAKCLPNLDTIFVRFANARYEVHGIRQNVVPFLTGIDVDATIERMRLVSERHAGELCGFQTVGYDILPDAVDGLRHRHRSVPNYEIANHILDERNVRFWL